MKRCNLTHTITRRLSASARAERGQAIVEFAIVLPVLILIILGIIYFGRYMDYSNQETQLAEEGARWASVNFNPTGGLQGYVSAQAQPELRSGSTDVSAAAVWIYQPSGATYAIGQPVRVCVATTVKLPFLNLTPLMAQTATMRIEQTATGTSTLPYGAGNPTGTMPSQCPTS